MDDTWVLSKLYELLGRRPRTTKEVSDWLTKRSAPRDQIERVLEKLIKIRLLDDAEYAKSFVRTQKILKPLSRRQIIYKLQKKGIMKKDILSALESEVYDEEDAARNEVEKNHWKWERFDPKSRLNKKIEFLLRKGFSYRTAKKIGGD